MDIDVNTIEADENFNCRGPISFENIKPLMENIENQGQLQAVTVTDRKAYYEKNNMEFHTPEKVWFLVAGFRRFRSFKTLGLPTIRAEEIPAGSKSEMLGVNLYENVQQSPLNMLQEAHAVNRMREYGTPCGWIASKINRPYQWVEARLNLIDLNDMEMWDAAACGVLNDKHVRKLHRLKNMDARMAYFRQIKDGKEGKNVREPKQTKAEDQKKARTRGECIEMIQYVTSEEVFGDFNIITRVLAWAAGNISDLDLFKDFKEILGERYTIPEMSLEAMLELQNLNTAGRGGKALQEFLDAQKTRDIPSS